jgi:hypothetical protein
MVDASLLQLLLVVMEQHQHVLPAGNDYVTVCG